MLKPQVTVWWKLWGYKFIVHLCVTFRCDCDGLSVFILKEVGSNDCSGPNSTPNGNFWLIEEALVMFIGICSRPLSKVLLINCAMPMKMCLITHQKVVQQVWIINQYSLKLMIKLQVYLFVLITQRMQNLQFV
jgi:hypothetical protein